MSWKKQVSQAAGPATGFECMADEKVQAKTEGLQGLDLSGGILARMLKDAIFALEAPGR
jgi:hypothetical protein